MHRNTSFSKSKYLTQRHNPFIHLQFRLSSQIVSPTPALVGCLQWIPFYVSTRNRQQVEEH